MKLVRIRAFYSFIYAKIAVTDLVVDYSSSQPKRRKSLGDIVGSLSTKARHLRLSQRLNGVDYSGVHLFEEESGNDGFVLPGLDENTTYPEQAVREPVDDPSVGTGISDTDLGVLAEEQHHIRTPSPTPSSYSCESSLKAATCGRS